MKTILTACFLAAAATASADEQVIHFPFDDEPMIQYQNEDGHPAFRRPGPDIVFESKYHGAGQRSLVMDLLPGSPSIDKVLFSKENLTAFTAPRPRWNIWGYPEHDSGRHKWRGEHSRWRGEDRGTCNWKCSAPAVPPSPVPSPMSGIHLAGACAALMAYGMMRRRRTSFVT